MVAKPVTTDKDKSVSKDDGSVSTQSLKAISMCYWNIHGWSSKIIGDKLCDDEFLAKFSNCDIVVLTELHSEKRISLPGFLNIKQKIRTKTHGGPKISGGLAVFIKDKFVEVVEPVANENPDSIWVKIRKEKSGEMEDVFIGSYYVSPGNRRNAHKDFYASISEEIENFKQKGIVVVQGDLNARVGRQPDFIEFDKHLDVGGIVPGSVGEDSVDTMGGDLGDQPPRNSEDGTVNSRGRDLLDLCKVNDLLIVNGRTAGDIFGKFTSHQYNGSAVNDYLLVPVRFFRRVSKFVVGDYAPWLSDHCPIYSNVVLTSLVTEGVSIEKQRDVEPGYIFDAVARGRFSGGLREMGDRVGEVLEDDCISATKLGDSIKLILIENAKRCKIKTKRVGGGRSGSARWFDGECENSKNEVRGLGKRVRGSPLDSGLRQSLQEAKKKLKQIVARKKRGYRQGIVDQMSRGQGGQRGIWGLLGKLSDRRPKTSSYVSHSYLTNHFKTLLNTGGGVDVPPICAESGQLDHEITLEELQESAKKSLPLGKGVGVDNLSNEMIACLVEIYPGLVLKLFNSILDTGEVMPDWVVSYIVPIYKSGPRSDPSNYRGVSLLSCLGKFFLSILNGRLTKFCVDRGILSDNQLGFVKGNRCSDAHLLIRNLVDKYCHKYGSKIYSCFIDLSKAFDTIPRDILLGKLRDVGITGNLFNIIRAIYTNDQAYIKLDGKIARPFAINRGVRQGCVLSPLLFNIFMAGLAKSLCATGIGFLLDNIKMNSLFWADDIVLFARDSVELEGLLGVVAAYCGRNKLTVNCKKTKCMIFNRTGRLYRDKITMNGALLDNVREYKYLGFIFTPSGEIKSGLRDLRDRAFRAFQGLRGKMGDSFNRDVGTALGLYDSLIKPILTYSSDFWGCMKLPKRDNPVEIMQMKVYKQILGVHRQTTNLGVLLELGRGTLDIECIKFGIKNWERIRGGDANKLIIDSYRSALGEDLPWLVGVEGHMVAGGLGGMPPRPDGKPFIYKKLYDVMYKKFGVDALATIKDSGHKLRTYSMMKTGVGLEDYLSVIRNVSVRTQFTKFRLSDHDLEIERGRHRGLDAARRFCPFCKDRVEDEIHFLLECPIYDELRNVEQIFRVDPTSGGSGAGVSVGDRFVNIVSEGARVAPIIHRLFELRNFLVSLPKRTN